MPYMENGSLLDYLKKERERLDVDYDAEEDNVKINSANLWSPCQVAGLSLKAILVPGSLGVQDVPAYYPANHNYSQLIVGRKILIYL